MDMTARPWEVRDNHERASEASDLAPQDTTALMREAMTRTYWSMINGGRCPYCGKPMTTERRGCCTHATPCGHKLWTGTRPR